MTYLNQVTECNPLAAFSETARHSVIMQLHVPIFYQKYTLRDLECFAEAPSEVDGGFGLKPIYNRSALITVGPDVLDYGHNLIILEVIEK
jgi:hypothetical protein